LSSIGSLVLDQGKEFHGFADMIPRDPAHYNQPNEIVVSQDAVEFAVHRGVF
jgi:hypothetical protein